MNVMRLFLRIFLTILKDKRQILKWPAILFLLAQICGLFAMSSEASQPFAKGVEMLTYFVTLGLILLAFAHLSLSLPRWVVQDRLIIIPQRKDLLQQCGRIILLSVLAGGVFLITVLLGISLFSSIGGMIVVAFLFCIASGAFLAIFTPLAAEAVNAPQGSLFSGFQLMRQRPFLMVGLALTCGLIQNILSIPAMILIEGLATLHYGLSLGLYALISAAYLCLSALLFLAMVTATFMTARIDA